MVSWMALMAANCCANCVVLDWERQHTRCTSCGADYGTHIESFFVKGRLRTGD